MTTRPVKLRKSVDVSGAHSRLNAYSERVSPEPSKELQQSSARLTQKRSSQQKSYGGSTERNVQLPAIGSNFEVAPLQNSSSIMHISEQKLSHFQEAHKQAALAKQTKLKHNNSVQVTRSRMSPGRLSPQTEDSWEEENYQEEQNRLLYHNLKKHKVCVLPDKRIRDLKQTPCFSIIEDSLGSVQKENLKRQKFDISLFKSNIEFFGYLNKQSHQSMKPRKKEFYSSSLQKVKNAKQD